jgi:serine protease inhibitor ecotin
VNTGSPADFTLFELDQVREEHFSLGVNVPNWKKRGRAVGVVLGDQAFACGESGAQH